MIRKDKNIPLIQFITLKIAHSTSSFQSQEFLPLSEVHKKKKGIP